MKIAKLRCRICNREHSPLPVAGMSQKGMEIYRTTKVCPNGHTANSIVTLDAGKALGVPVPSIEYGAAPPFSFTPTDLPGLELWLKADAGVTESGGLVSAWQDQSGNNRHPSVIASPTLLAAALNGLPAIDFNGTTQYLETTTAPTLALAGKGACEIIMVMRRNSSDRLDPLLDWSLSAAASVLYHDIPSNNFFRVGGRSSLADGFNEAADNVIFVEDNFELVSMIVSPATSMLKYYLNNALRINTSGTFSQSTFATSSGTQNTLFAYFDGTATADITVAEVLVYSSELSNADKDKIAWHINQRYGLSVPYLVGDPSL